MRSRCLCQPRSERGAGRFEARKRAKDEGFAQADRASATDPTESLRLRSTPSSLAGIVASRRAAIPGLATLNEADARIAALLPIATQLDLPRTLKMGDDQAAVATTRDQPRRPHDASPGPFHAKLPRRRRPRPFRELGASRGEAAAGRVQRIRRQIHCPVALSPSRTTTRPPAMAGWHQVLPQACTRDTSR